MYSGRKSAIIADDDDASYVMPRLRRIAPAIFSFTGVYQRLCRRIFACVQEKQSPSQKMSRERTAIAQNIENAGGLEIFTAIFPVTRRPVTRTPAFSSHLRLLSRSRSRSFISFRLGKNMMLMSDFIFGDSDGCNAWLLIEESCRREMT